MLFNLKTALQYRRISQKDLAGVLCLSEAEISLRITGKREFAPHEKTRTAELLGFNPTWLFQPHVIRPESGFQRREVTVLTPPIETRKKF